MLKRRWEKNIQMYIRKLESIKNRKFLEILNLRNIVTETKHLMNEFKSRIVNRREDW